MKFSTGVPNCREGRLNPIGPAGRWRRAVLSKTPTPGPNRCFRTR